MSGRFTEDPGRAPLVTATAHGLMRATDKAKVDGLATGAQVNVLESVTGTAPIVAGAIAAKSQDISITPATASLPGSMSAANFAKLATLAPPVLRLNYAPVADLLNGAALAAATWTDVTPNQAFTVGSATAPLLVILRLKVLVTAASVDGLGARLVFNAAGTPVAIVVAGGVVTPAAGWGSIPGADLWLPGAALPTGSNTVKVQVYSEVACTAYCRLGSAPNVDILQLQIIEVSA